MLTDDLVEWQSFICNPTGAGRHLGGILGGPYERRAALLELDDDALHAFLKRIAVSDVELLSLALELADPAYLTFAQAVPGLITRLSSRRTGVKAVVGPGLWGEPLFVETLIARRISGLAPDSFVARVPVKDLDTPENVVLGWLAADLGGALGAFGRDWPLPTRLGTVARGAWMARAALRRAGPPRKPTSQEIRVCKSHPLPAYRLTARAAERRLRSTAGNRAERLGTALALLRSTWLSPTNLNDVFELYGLTLVLDIMERDLGLGPPVCYSIGTPGRDYVAEFAGGMRVYFDRSPTAAFRARSHFDEILKGHIGLRGKVHRPDIVVASAANGEGRRAVAVEMKRSSDSEYISRSVYKALGYVKDFEDIWPREGFLPRVILVTLGNVMPKGNPLPIMVVPAHRDAVVRGLVSSLGLA